MTETRAAGADALTRLILEHKDKAYLDALKHPALNEDHIKLILRDDAVPANVIKAIHDNEALISKYPVKVALVNNPRTPKVMALNLVKFLFWRDLVKTSHNIKLTAPVRFAAEVNLKDRLYEITLGEKISLARVCSREIIKDLRFEHNEMIFRALLGNPLMTEEDVMVVLNSPKTPGNIIKIIAHSEKWSSRYPIKVALVRNPKTPTHVGMAILPTLLQKDLKGLCSLPSVPRIIKHGAARALGSKRRH